MAKGILSSRVGTPMGKEAKRWATAWMESRYFSKMASACRSFILTGSDVR
jgi:hypothetical protein